MGRRRPDENLTIRVDPDILLWARMRALVGRTSVHRVLRRFLEAYAQVPESWWEGRPPAYGERRLQDLASQPEPTVEEVVAAEEAGRR